MTRLNAILIFLQFIILYLITTQSWTTEQKAFMKHYFELNVYDFSNMTEDEKLSATEAILKAEYPPNALQLVVQK
jgi:hypothetical protein